MTILNAVTAVSLAHAGETKNYVYRIYDPKTDRLLDTELKSITVEDNGLIKVHHLIQGDADRQEEIYTLDAGLGSREWSIRDTAEELDYRGYRKGNTLYFQGRLKNGPVEKEASVDDDPVCNHPKVTLS